VAAKAAQKVLLIRLDKIGDLICTLCVDQVSFLKNADTQWVIAKGLSFVPENADPKRSFLELSKDDWKISLKALRKFIREFQPDVAVSFQAPWWVNFALWAEKVPVRAGVQSQWHSFLFLNRGLRQRRSFAVKHEADYNKDLLGYAMGVEAEKESTPVLKLIAPPAPGLFEKHQLVPGNYIVVHPGMAGSALNWPIPNYLQLIAEVSEKTQVVITGTAGDEAWLTEIKAKFKHNTRVLILQNKLNTKELMLILKHAKAVVVPSTGVAHIAASLGTPVLGIYSPLRVQHPRRWAARGDKVQIFMPEGHDPDTADSSCMEEIKVSDLIKALNKL
jgi:ADP-heptose:LPS heptosyltransferase